MTDHYYQPDLVFTINEVMQGMSLTFTTSQLLARMEAHSFAEHNYKPSFQELENLRERMRNALPILERQGKIELIASQTENKTPLTIIKKIK
jgi:hypothetical protein